MRIFSASRIRLRNFSGTVWLRPGAGRVALVFQLLILFGFGWASYSWAKMYHGQVVDEETGKPLEGAVVVVVWHKKPIVSMDAPEYFHDAKETLTDGEGKFTLNASPAIDWNPFTMIKEPNIVIFQPGYEPFALLRTLMRQGFHSFEDIDTAFQKGAVIKLPKLKSRDELIKFSGFGDVLIGGVPFEKIPNLKRAFDIQRKMVGLPPYY